ncbi:MAG: hypothetical protein ABJN65_16545 [Parasphingorhabdus sp.]
MRKILLTLSALALPLAACSQEEKASPELDPVVQDGEESAMTPEVETRETEPTEETESSTGEETASEEKATQ